MDYSEKWGKDEEEAIKLALLDLKLTREEVDVIVLEESSKGFFGIGSKLAKVRIQKKKAQKAGEKPVVKEEKKEAPIADLQKNTEKKPVKTEFVKKEDKEPREREVKENTSDKVRTKRYDNPESLRAERPGNLVAVEHSPALDFLREVTEKMGIEVIVTAEENESSIYLDISGKDSGTVIGKRGQTLDAIQYLTRLVVNKEDEKYKRVVVDAESYRSKREKTLEQLASRLADKVVRTRKSVRLEPMNPYERKIIHATLQSNPKVTTRSEGEEPYRRVIIEMK